MHKGRLEAFSDGVLAIVITIMVLELKVPHGTDPGALLALAPVFLSYVLSFVYVGIYWNNHHHMMQAVHRVDGAVLWANLHLLFWLSLFPFVSGWLGENHFAGLPVALYGVVLLAAAVAYYILVVTLRRLHGPETEFARAVGGTAKERLSLLFYFAAIPLAFVAAWASLALYVGVAVVWLIPDRRFEKVLLEVEGIDPRP
ncbi:DUF1211 domain-containing protein [Siculibacillus lacustris]|uniref:DUF1211 domain-containing protein n=1 Tax=Siculibacillus lacustris TaxID=1549641 RepID=A0A4Q9VQA7_9HYPH|nr:TMEM175 family protein [Siculibacillus lacustris]TBW37972.1 DUF1211 domain-containing protein [Siculibacillus lacustris]